MADLTTSPLSPTRSQGLVDVLDRILDKGLVIAGDIRVNLANVELLTIQVRLLVCSIDKAEQIGLTWWKTDPLLAGNSAAADHVQLELENMELRERLQRVEEQLERLAAGPSSASEARPARSRQSKPR
ncbi:MAG TPA: gas vesicle protein [Gemmatimonadaceae bacterium]|nr:gas vesicle protein [Gemmatimonadaceae bacterium]